MLAGMWQARHEQSQQRSSSAGGVAGNMNFHTSARYGCTWRADLAK